MPELPQEMRLRLERDYSLSPYDASALTVDREIAGYFYAAVVELRSDPKLCANWVMGELSGYLNERGKLFDSSPLSPVQLGQLLQRVKDGTISGKIAKEVFKQMWSRAGESGWKSRDWKLDENLADRIIESQGLKQISDSGELERLVDEVIAANAKSVEEFKAGKEKAFNALVGQVMKAAKGKANPAQVNEIMRRKLVS